MNILRLTANAVGILLVSLLLHLALYQTVFTLERVSNVLFVVSIIAFLMALIMKTGAFQVFLGFGYSFRVLWGRDFRNQYPNYSDYRDERNVKTTGAQALGLLLVSSVFLIVAIVMGRFV